jgi:hypothetical protein
MSVQPRSSRAQSRDPDEVTLKVSRRDPSTSLGMTILSAGFQTTVQDCGRIAPAVIPNRAGDEGSHARSEVTHSFERSFGPSRTGVVCAAQDDTRTRAAFRLGHYLCVVSFFDVLSS